MFVYIFDFQLKSTFILRDLPKRQPGPNDGVFKKAIDRALGHYTGNPVRNHRRAVIRVVGIGAKKLVPA